MVPPTNFFVPLAARLGRAATRVALGRPARLRVTAPANGSLPEGVRGANPAGRVMALCATPRTAVERPSVGGTWHGSPYELFRALGGPAWPGRDTRRTWSPSQASSNSSGERFLAGGGSGRESGRQT